MDIAYTSATELAERIRCGDESPTEVVDYFLNRIARRNDELNAFVTTCDERAKEAALEAERAIEKGNDIGPLHGVPVAVKDLTNVAGVPTTFGSKLFADFVPDNNDVIVNRLEAAGAIIIGKTNTPEFGRKPMTTNLLHGTTSNPWNMKKTVGGSSGGSAAALADGLVPLATGSDAAGSLRVPASACGIASLMADFGRVPKVSRPDGFVNTHPYTFAGPMARTVDDLVLMLDVISGPNNADPFCLPERAGDYLDIKDFDMSILDVAYSPDLGICEVASPVTDIVEDAVNDFRDAGATIEQVDAIFHHDWNTLHDALEVLLQDRYLGMYDNFKRDKDLDLLENRDAVTNEVISRIETALELEAIDVRRAERIRTEAHDTIREVLTEFDIIVTPTMGILPFDKETEPAKINNVQIDPLHGWILTWPINLTGNPVAALPAGFVDGIPVGLQIIGSRHDDATVVNVAAAYERIRPWTKYYPAR